MDIGVATDLPERIGARRALVVGLNLVSWLAIAIVVTRSFGAAGWQSGLVLALFLLGLPWTLLAFWNSVIGFIILRTVRDPAGFTNPALRATQSPITGRIAVCVAIRHENVQRVAANLATMRASLDATDEADRFEVHILSDSTRPDICAEEEATFGADPALRYRRRAANVGYKAGNLRDFALAHVGLIDCMIVLDADSLMSGPAMVRLARVMQANPRLGILQTLVVGAPATSAFARIFQFGMRHGMRTHTTGIAWWQGSSGPYWGHNAIIRLRPFVELCDLPVLPSGPILSHDQVEAALMRAGGMEVRVIADEFESWEENPARLPDFVRRDLRWCQGNLQYWRLLGRPGFRPMGRFQLGNAVAMYLGAPSALLMLLVGGGSLAGMLYVGFLALGFAPRLLGVIDVLLRPAECRRWGGAARLLAGAATDGVFSLIVGPVMMVAQTRFILGLAFGRRMIWEAQQRDDRRLEPGAAARGLWPQLVFGVVLLALHPVVWALPAVLGACLAIPFATITANPRLGGWMCRNGLCAIPEETARH